MTFSTTATVVPTAPIWVESGTATPVASFDGASVGITYTRQIFRWNRVGGICFFDGRITLSSKGSSTGTFRLCEGAFPYASIDVDVDGYPAIIRCLSFASTIGDTDIFGDVIAGESVPYLRLYRYSSGSAVSLSDPSLTDTSDIIFNGHYRVA